MIMHNGQGWLTTLADLSIILFMVTASDLSTAQAQLQREQAATPAPRAQPVLTAEPIAIYRPAQGAVPLATWLAMQPADDRQRLTVIVRYNGKDVAAALAQGMNLADQAKKAGHSPRVIVEQGEIPEIAAFLAYDAAPKVVAQDLLETGQPATREPSTNPGEIR